MRQIVFLMFAALVAVVSPATASQFGSKEEAVAMVKRVQAEFKKDGAEATFKAVSDKSTTAWVACDPFSAFSRICPFK